MILAQEKYGVNYLPEKNAAKQLPKEKKHKFKTTPNFGYKTALIFVIISAFVLGILLTAQFAKIARASFTAMQLKQEIAALETTNERLYLEVLQLQSLERIENIALKRLGMVYVEQEEKQQVAVVNDKGFQPANNDSAGRKVKNNIILVDRSGKQLNPIIQAISQIINWK